MDMVYHGSMGYQKPSYPIQCHTCANCFMVDLYEARRQLRDGIELEERRFLLRCPACRAKTMARDLVRVDPES